MVVAIIIIIIVINVVVVVIESIHVTIAAFVPIELVI